MQYRLAIAPRFLLLEARCSQSQFELLGQREVDDSSLFTLAPRESPQAVISYVPEKKHPARCARHSDHDGAVSTQCRRRRA